GRLNYGTLSAPRVADLNAGRRAQPDLDSRRAGRAGYRRWLRLASCPAPAARCLTLGRGEALAVGVPVVSTRLQVLALATGAATAVSGSIAFVGLMVPHLVRRRTGPRALDLLPACVAGGAAF